MIKRIKLPGNVWRLVHDDQGNQLYLDLRVDGNSPEIGKLDLESCSISVKKLTYPTQSELVGSQGNELYFVKYTDPNDPNEQDFFSLSWVDGKMVEGEEKMLDDEKLILPQVYLHGSDHHQTVAKYLKAELPLSCEYLEWSEHIVISYYSRHKDRYQRHLLILKGGNKKAELMQDQEINGFSPGAFFVVDDRLIFIKDKNEVCIYAD